MRSTVPQAALGLLLLGSATRAATLLARAATPKVFIPSTSFDSTADFEKDWDYLYPWGTDHNGGARMDKKQIALSGGVLTLTATKVSGQKPASQGGKTIDIHYLSGTVYAKQHVTVAAGGGYDFYGEFRATTTKGTWPAWWVSGLSWPPEIDMAEWKGSGKISFNTFNTSSSVKALDVTYPSPGDFHRIKTEVRDENGKDVAIRFYMDDKLVTTQYGKGFVGKPCYLIMDLQMEGSSGSPGPSTDTLFQARNVSVLSYNP